MYLSRHLKKRFEFVNQTNTFCDDGETLFEVSNAPWGSECPRGGIVIYKGMDDNMDGVLDEAEIDDTSFVCNAYVTDISLGFDHSCALLSNGTIRCWGSSEYGQLGDGSRRASNVPVGVINP